METLPSELIALISTFLSTNEKECTREVCKDFYYNIRLMHIKVGKMDKKLDAIFDGRIYILNRLRLAALSGLSTYKVADIWTWIENQNSKEIIIKDALPFLRELNSCFISF